ncbi:MAG: ABC transporter permease [Desulfatibacillaceae bacterium]
MYGRKLAAAAVVVTAVNLLPVAALFSGALTGPGGGFSLGAFKNLLLSSRQLVLLGDTLLLAAGAAVFACLLGAPLAFLAARTDVPGRRLLRALYLFPLLIPPYVHALVWTGPLNPAALPWPDFPWFPAQPSMYSLPGGVLVFALAYFPLVTLIVSAGLHGTDRNTEEAALLARGPRAALFRVTVPLVAPQLLCAGILVFLFTMVNFEVADILRLKVYPLEIFINFSAYYDERAAAVLAAPLVAAAMILILAQMLFMQGRSYVDWRGGQSASVYRLGWFRKPAAAWYAVVLLAGLGLPVVCLVLGTGGTSAWARIWKSSMDAVVNSVWLAAAGAVVITTVSIPVACYLVRTTGRLRSLVDYLTQVPLGVPSIAIGIGSIHVYNRAGLDRIYGTSAVLILALACGYAPFVIRVLTARLRQVDREWEEAGMMAGRKPFRVFLRVTLPQLAPGIAAGLLVGYVLCLANLGTALLLVPPGSETAPISIYNYLHYGARDAVFALSLILVGAAALPLLLIYPLYRKWTSGLE